MFMIRFLLLLTLFFALLPVAGFGQKSKKNKKAAVMAANDDPFGVASAAVFNKAFTGFALFDPETGDMLDEYNADRYYTPASNTKIFTLYASLRLLGDSIPALQYSKQGDLLLFWGTGDPSFLNPDLQQNPLIFNFLASRTERLLFCPNNFTDTRYGSGWMWSDYPYLYQAEKSPFTIYGNVAHFRQDATTPGIVVLPSILKNNLTYDPTLSVEDFVGREEFDNNFTYNTIAAKGDQFEWHVPFRYTPALLAEMLSDTLKRPVYVFEVDMTPPADSKTLYSVKADSLYVRMMQESDNFIAEQLLMLCSWQKFGVMNTEKIIGYASKNLINDLPDELQWVDGSGLSRYNLFTPRSVVKLLHKLYQTVPQDRLFGIFPAGGVNGTIKSNYRNGAKPYVFAKTGTLRNNHCLSGYVLTKKGKVLIFSFMHNNFANGLSAIKREMERVLRQVYEEY
jgi:D-alanyl-D-alanine carboxypeptidase/D-alanyl-D-alanine-endopeptidase (penicillin-binding protein 4)